MARTYSGTPEPRYVEKAKYAENGGGGVTVDELIDKTAAGIGVSIDKTEDESKMQIGLDCPSIILTDDQIVEGDNPTFELTEEQIAIIENVNATIIFVNAESANLGATYYKRYCTDDNEKIRFIAIKYDIGSGDEITQLDAEALVFSPDTSYLVYSTFPFPDISGKLDANKQAVATVGGLVTPTAAPTLKEIVGIGTDGSQIRIQLGDGLELTGNTSPYTLSASGGGGGGDGTKIYRHTISIDDGSDYWYIFSTKATRYNEIDLDLFYTIFEDTHTLNVSYDRTIFGICDFRRAGGNAREIYVGGRNNDNGISWQSVKSFFEDGAEDEEVTLL